MRTIALSVLRARIAKEADYPAFTASTRHTINDVNRMVNDSWQDMRVRVSQHAAGSMLFSKVFSSTTATGVTAPYAWQEIAMPTDVAHITGVDLILANGRPRSLQHLPWSARNDYFNSPAYPTTNQTGSPLNYMVYNVGVEVAAAVTPGKIGLLPAPDKVYSYNLWYVPVWADRTADTDVFDGIAGWDDYVVWDCTVKIAIADNDMQAALQGAQIERERSFEKMIESASNFQRTTPIVRRETQEWEDYELDSKFWER